ncbi:MAG: oligosaccharide flippase family protein [Candidatus Promineifilaceae bacterium]
MTQFSGRLQSAKTRLIGQLSEKQDTLFFLMATTAAYGFDYLFNLVSGRLLGPAGFSVIVSLAALGQLFVLGSRVIQTVTTRYVSEFRADNNRQKVAVFFNSALRRAIIGGAVLTGVLLLLSTPIASFLRIESIPPVVALLLSVWLMTFRPVIGGTLQGEQRFIPLGIVQMTQASMRLLLAAAFISLGWGVFGAMVALPIASFIAFLYGLYALRDLRTIQSTVKHDIPFADFFRYTSYASIGLVGFAVLINMDALLVKRFFEPEIAGLYGSAITLGKVVQFFPVAIVMILFPKASQRQAANRDPATVLPPAFGLITLVCVGVSLLYFAFPTQLISLLFGAEYQLDGPVLGLIGIAMWQLSLMNVWLNYFLSLDQPHYVLLVWVGVAIQASAFFIWHDYLWQLPTAMALNGLWLTIAGGIVFRRQRRSQVR